MRNVTKTIAVLVLGVACGAGVMWIIAHRPAINISGVLKEPGLPVAGTGAPSVGAPVQLTIPAIGVSGAIIPVGLVANGDIGAPTNATSVVWYTGSPRPGNSGVSIIDGHLDTIHAPEAIFYNLGKLQPGDEVDVATADGATIKFTVTRVATFPYNTPTQDIFTATSTSESDLDLITCAGDWNPAIKLYNDRLVVFTKKE